MDKKIKRKWVKALRSGRYKQCDDDYYRHGAYCCLGVLLRINGTKPKHGAIEFQPGKFLDKFGLSFSDADALADLNDSGATFDQIAMCIENGL